jgi:hypothetical protein
MRAGNAWGGMRIAGRRQVLLGSRVCERIKDEKEDDECRLVLMFPRYSEWLPGCSGFGTPDL